MDFSRFSLARILPAFKRRLKEIPYILNWKFSKHSIENKIKLKEFKDKYTGKRVILICNGPSIKETDLSLIKDEYTICLNRFYIYFDKIGFIPNFYVCMVDLVLEQFKDDIEKLPCIKFVNWRLHNFFHSTQFLKEGYSFNPYFQEDITKPMHGGGTVTYTSLQLAYYMGFKEVVIIGMDHNFKEKGLASTVEVRSYEKDESHFDPNYFPKGTKWILPDLDKSEYSYHLANVFYNNNNRKILDATVGGHCQVFDKVDYYSYFKK